VNQQVVLDWFDQNKRDLPWRNTTPWGVIVSEFMLQQTPVNRVLPIWSQWMVKWPTALDLSLAKKSEVVTAWGRLGYPRRALRLYESAGIIARDFNNQVPRALEDLRTLPGVGEYTAAAISAFAFGESALVLDVNIRRLFARVIDGVEHPTPSPSQIERRLRYELIPAEGAKWAAATMEFGALVCTSKNPVCEACPLQRGTIVQALRENEKLTPSALKKLWHDNSQIEKALKTLVADGLIETTGKSFRLAD
jgi:A/G-specific adenine glycosylase